jgi:hypothetical protein
MSLEELLPVSKRPVTRLWTSRRKIHCWETYSVRGKAAGESMGELYGKRQSSGRIAGRVTAGKATWQVSCLARESLGKLEGFLPLSSRSVTKPLPAKRLLKNR